VRKGGNKSQIKAQNCGSTEGEKDNKRKEGMKKWEWKTRKCNLKYKCEKIKKNTEGKTLFKRKHRKRKNQNRGQRKEGSYFQLLLHL
jgi:hypothetical protein